MATNRRIEGVVLGAIDDLNQLLPKERRLAKSLDTNLYGISGKLDSLGLVNLIVAVEQRVKEEFGVTIDLADKKALSSNNSPFETIGTLADYVGSVLESGANGL